MSYLGQDVNPVTPTDVAVNGSNLGGVPLFSVQWWPNRSSIPTGYVPGDGQELSQSIYPDANNGIAANMVPLVVEATWQSTPTERGKYVAVSSTGKFRVPDYNGKSAGSLGAVFMRGDGTLSAAINGVIQPDALKSHNHTQTSDGKYASNSLFVGNAGSAAYATVSGTGYTGSTGDVETRPLNVTGCWIIKIFGAVINPGTLDASKVVLEQAALRATVQVDKGFISGLRLVYTGRTSLTITAGSAYIPGTGKTVELTDDRVYTGMSLTPNVMYHVYLYDNAGVAGVELVTTAPVGYFGSAYNKTGDTTRRYIGTLITGSGGFYGFRHDLMNSRMTYIEGQPGTAPFTMWTAFTTTTPVLVNSQQYLVIPRATATKMTICTSTTGQMLFSPADQVNTPGSSLWGEQVNAQGSFLDITLSRTPATVGQFYTWMGSGTSSAYCTGYLFER